MRWILIVAVALLCQACVNQTQLAKEAVENHVLHSNQITFREMKSYPGSVVCGEFSTRGKAKDKHFKPFIYRLETVDIRPGHEDLAIFCSPDALRSLYDVTGINVSDEFALPISHIRKDFIVLGTALALYESDNFMFPKTRQGLGALLEASDIEPKPRRFKAGGYLDKLPLDPWNRPYLYTGPGLGGVKGSYNILTLGADGKEGGVDANADIGSHQMKYLLHIEQL